MSKVEPPAELLVVNETSQPCGCVSNEMSDKSVRTMPCFGHGLLEVAHGLSHAVQALTAMGNRGVAEATQATMNEIAESMSKGPTGLVKS